MRTSFKADDVELLLKDITGLVDPLGTKEREARIQSGVHYSEMLPLEYEPSPKYLAAYYEAVERFSPAVAKAVGTAATRLAQTLPLPVMVSLARAGTSSGVLIKHYLRRYYGIDAPHYSISIIRGRGIDKVALDYILARHSADQLIFVDGWVGKGAIKRTLVETLHEYPEVKPRLLVLSDPCGASDITGTSHDLLIPSSLLNSTVSGLISRTFLRSDIIGTGDFHGAMYYAKWEAADLTYHFIESVEKHFQPPAELREFLHTTTTSGKPTLSTADGDSSTSSSSTNAETAAIVDTTTSDKHALSTANSDRAKDGTADSSTTSSSTNAGAAASTDSTTSGTPTLSTASTTTSSSKPAGLVEAERIAADFAISDINLVKVGIGEATRVLLRRVPKVVLVHDLTDSINLGHLLTLAKEKGVPIKEYPLQNYLACGIIQELGDA